MISETKNITDTIDYSQCTGCGACINCCPADALYFGRDKWGYYIPSIDNAKCVSCGKCINICPVVSKRDDDHFESPDCYAFINGDKNVLDASTSGGIFTKLAKAVFQNKGVVYGASWDSMERDQPWVIHKAVTSEDNIGTLRKSKYMQSFMGYAFRDIKTILEEGTFVLFSGCPCQVAGLKAYLEKDYDNLILVDLLCGNSPSELFFKTYVNEVFGDNVVSYEFRYKDNYWRSDTVCVTLRNGEKRVLYGKFDDAYQAVYHDHTMCPPHCENCMFHSVPREGDLTIGDFWGITRRDPAIPGNNGVSAILINSQKGKIFWDGLEHNDKDFLRKVPIEWLGGNGYTGKRNSNYCSKYRDKFYADFLEVGFSKAVHNVEKLSLRDEIEKYRSFFETLLEWVKKADDVEWLANHLISKGFTNIAIYGMGDLGQVLYHKLKTTAVNVAYAIDRRPPQIGEAIRVIKPDEEMEPVDVIIVTVDREFDAIKNMLQEKTDNKIISLRDVFN